MGGLWINYVIFSLKFYTLMIAPKYNKTFGDKFGLKKEIERNKNGFSYAFSRNGFKKISKVRVE